ncbi:16S rRNA (cytosine967-C5)-methyltransferase [Extensimonas vulgaris]|uniref:16S rRNA (cytosine(967)-C(5))-methyltransferase n=2 Tax=Extensimonas vulgaris TaxID=1031594 RepID=A0A369AM78_9BURK|nr:16S rRNA (cytosine(967)-C(5))-methyltransferase RsmB [Extensimonas vulgaris]RCX09277.1 16S rRNA (cytosine967-C5)-methyltransferase [Extensimonas vulgaris]TWI37860.1 16S rRNA (cytosine967-C5)-methyltransferase [Extensimonas vulgaris]TXD15990.1 16S rRNA (cytosine(967)-C(5))-methyltransferase RsmB [Extensimonas vulgaris]
MRQAPTQARTDAGATAPLWQLLATVASTLQSVLAGRSATAALETVAPSLRPGVQSLLYQTLRSLGRAQVLRSRLVARTPPPPVDALLCTALALCWHEAKAPYPAHTLLHQTVEAAKHRPATRAQAGFVNACLRRFLRERAALIAATDADPLAHWNHPPWWVRRLQIDHPQAWQQILQAADAPAPMVLRVNQQKCTPAQYLQALEAINIEASPVGVSGLVLRRPVPVQQLPGFEAGWVSVQDAGAQLAAPLLLQGLNLHAPLRVLDACAAPGGKTAHLLELAPPGASWHVTALEVDAARSGRIHANLARLGLHAQVLVADAACPQDWWRQSGGLPFDAILLDAPCTASGIVRRHPDVRWLRRPTDIDQLAAQQARLLNALWPLLRPGGRLLYCTCSVFRAEGEDQVQMFLAHHKDAARMPAPGHLLPTSADNRPTGQDDMHYDHDGFFYALLEKKPA